MIRTVRWQSVVAAGLLQGLIGCGPERTTETVVPARVRLAYGGKIHYAPQILALRRGFFRDAGVDVDGKVLMAGIQCAEALITGAVDVAVMGDAPAVMALASAPGVRLVTSYGGGERMHRIVVRPGAPIRQGADLAGRTIGVQKGSSTHGALLLYLEHHGLTPEEVRLLDISPRDMSEAMLAGQLDAAAGSEPWPTNIQERIPDSTELAVLSGLGNEFPLVMLTTAAFAEQCPGALAAMVEATRRAVHHINAAPGAAAEEIAAVTGVPPERELKVLKSLQWQVRMDAGIVASLEQTAQFLAGIGRIAEAPDVRARTVALHPGGEAPGQQQQGEMP